MLSAAARLGPQVIRACIPVFTALGSVVIERKLPSKAEWLSLLVLVCGVAIAVYDGTEVRWPVTLQSSSL